MRERRKLKVGLAPTRRAPFRHPETFEQKRLIEAKLASWGVDVVSIDGINDEGVLFCREDVPKALEALRDADALFIPHVNFGCEDAISRLARDLGKPTLLWGPRDAAPGPNGERPRDTQCGLFATSKVLRRMGVPFSYIVNSRVDSAVFERGFRNFLGAAAAANAFRGARIGQVSTRPTAFWTMMINEGELLERWGIEVVPPRRTGSTGARTPSRPRPTRSAPASRSATWTPRPSRAWPRSSSPSSSGSSARRSMPSPSSAGRRSRMPSGSSPASCTAW